MIYSILRFCDLAISNFKVASFSVSLFFFFLFVLLFAAFVKILVNVGALPQNLSTFVE